MKNLITAAMLAVAAASMGACATSKEVAMRTIIDSPVGQGATQESVGKAIRTSLVSRLWTIEEETDSSVIASITSEGSHEMARIKVDYDADSFSIHRLETLNFRYSERFGTISSRYNRWITNIEHDVMIRTGVPVEEANEHVYRAHEDILAKTVR